MSITNSCNPLQLSQLLNSFKSGKVIQNPLANILLCRRALAIKLFQKRSHNLSLCFYHVEQLKSINLYHFSALLRKTVHNTIDFSSHSYISPHMEKTYFESLYIACLSRRGAPFNIPEIDKLYTCIKCQLCDNKDKLDVSIRKIFKRRNE